MTVLRSQIDELRTELTNINNSNDTQILIEAYRNIQSKLHEIISIHTVIKKWKGIHLIPKDEIGVVKPSVSEEEIQDIDKVFHDFEQKWKTDDYLVLQNNSLSLTIKKISNFNSSLLVQIDEYWETWKKSILSECALSEEEIRLASNIESNINLLEQYRSLMRQLNDELQEIPSVDTTITRIISIRDSIIEIKKDLDLENIPEDVKIFLDKINRLSSFPIEDFTPAIKEWLLQHNMLDKFVIKRR